MLTLTLEKAGAEPPKKLQLSLNKGARFTVEISWKCNAAHEDDVDIHALEASNTGNGATVTALESVLSTYNTKKMNPRAGVLVNKPDGSFSTPSGGLTHSGDIRVQGSFETITVDGTYLPDGVNEIPLFATVHRANHGSEHETPEHDSDEEAAFADIEVCIVTISDSDGRELQSYQLSDEFGDFNVVQMGSVLLGENGWEYAPVGRGFTGTINDVLAHFS